VDNQSLLFGPLTAASKRGLRSLMIAYAVRRSSEVDKSS
jgi:hypothetical protein